MVQNKNSQKRGRPRRFDINTALDEAIAVFWELGYHASDVETLCKRMGLSKPSLYNSFGAKEDLFIAAVERYMSLRNEGVRAALDNGANPEESLLKYFHYIAECSSAQNQPKGCLVTSIAIPLMDQLPQLAGILRAKRIETHEQFTQFFQMYIDKGELPKNFDSNQAISLIQDLNAALIVQARAGSSLIDLKNKAKRNTCLVLAEGMV